MDCSDVGDTSEELITLCDALDRNIPGVRASTALKPHSDRESFLWCLLCKCTVSKKNRQRHLRTKGHVEERRSRQSVTVQFEGEAFESKDHCVHCINDQIILLGSKEKYLFCRKPTSFVEHCIII